MLLAAHLRAGHSDRSRNSTDRIQALLDVIQQHSLPLPASLHLEALVALANAREGSSGAVEIASLVQANADNLPHARLSEVLQLAARRSMRELGVLTWDIIEWRCSPLPSDRYHAALLGLSDDVDVLKGRIERTIGSLDHPDALDVLLRKYIVSNDIVAAQTTFDKLVALRPTRVAYDRMLAFYAAHARADDAIELFDSMLLRGIQPTLASLTSLVALFANRRDVENAQNVFDMIPAMGFTPDSAAWTAIMNAEVEAGQWTAAALRWQGMPDDMKQTRSVLGVVMKAYLHMAAPTSKVLEVFESAREEDRTGHMWSVAIQSAVDDRDFDLAESLFERMRRAYTANASRPEPSVFHYSILLYGYMQADQQSRAKQVYDAMLERGIVPTSVTYGMMLSSWRHADGVTAYAQASRFARSVHLHAVQSNEKPRARGGAMENIYGPLISLSGNIGDMETAEGYLKLAATPLNAMGGKARGDPALTGQEMMLDENGAGVGELSSMTAQDVEAHFASDRPAQALTMYTRLLDVYRRSGQTDSVMAIWDHIFALACRVSKETASKHLTGVRSRRSRDNILCIPLSIVLDSLGAAGRLMDVRSTWERVSKAGFGFDAQNYNHYAVALARMGDVERAFAVVEDVLYPRYRAVIKRQMRAVREAERLEGERVTSASHLDADANIEDVWESGPRVMPENMTRIALQEGNSLNGADIITQPAQRPPNRRSEQRWAGGAFNHGEGRDDVYGPSSWGAESTHGEDPSSGTGTGNNGKRPSIDVTMLKAWRTTDILWRPSVTTISVLEHVWKQLQEAKSRAWFVLADGGGEGDADADAEEDGVGVAGGTKSAHANGNGQDGGVVTLPAFGDVPVRDANGEISKSSPTAIIMRLNKRYVKTVALIMFHRRKRHAANLKARRGG
jgi:pentatricopeptide repeat protein